LAGTGSAGASGACAGASGTGAYMLGAYITDVARGSVHDGPGVRSVVYFKGCPLRCAWCHNPETLLHGPEILAYPARCVSCGRCVSVCPSSCHGDAGDARLYDRERCARCGKCAEACPAGALAVCGKRWPLADLHAELLKDKVYYRRTGGGVTLSGGECLLYPGDAASLLGLLKAGGVHTAIETSLCVPWPHIERVIPLTDAFLVDIKHMDAVRHAAFAGHGNALILDNLRRLAAAHGDITVRVPLVPGVNDDLDNLVRTARAALSIGGGIRRAELLKFNPLGGSKYAALGQTAAAFADGPQSGAQMDAICERVNGCLGVKDFVYYRA